MYKHILVATDGSKLSQKAVTHAIALAQALGAKMTVFYASPDYPLPAYADGVVYEPVSKKEYAALATQEAEKILSAIAEKAEAGGLECATVHTIAPAPWEAILAAAKKAYDVLSGGTTIFASGMETEHLRELSFAPDTTVAAVLERLCLD